MHFYLQLHRNIISKTVEFNFFKNISIDFENESIYLPVDAINQPKSDFKKTYNFAITSVKLLNLRQYMSPIKELIYPSIVSVYFGFTQKNQLINLHKLKFTLKHDNNHGVGKCITWNLKWNLTQCTTSYNSNDRETSCYCNRLGSFALVDNFYFQPSTTSTIKHTFSTSPLSSTKITNLTTTTQPPIDQTQPPDLNVNKISNKINNVLKNITKESINSTDQWKETLTQLTDLVSSITSNDETIAKVNKTLAHKITNSSLNSFNQLIEAPKNVWQNLSVSEQKNISSKIFKTVSSLSVLMNAKQLGKLTVLSFSSIEMHTNSFVLNESNHIHFVFNNSATIKMPISAYFDFTNVSAGKPLDKIATSAVLMSNISQYLSSGSFLPNSAILSITVEKERESVNLKNGHKLMFV